MTTALSLPDGPDYDEFARLQGPRLTRMVLRRLDDRGEAEDIAQEALLRAHKHWDEFADASSAAAWVTTVTQRLVIDRLRVRHRLVSVPQLPEGARLGRDTADVVVGRQEARTALEALEAMPARQASVLWAREVEGLSYGAIAARHGMSEPTVRSLLARGRKALRREYASRGGTVPVGALVPLAPVLAALRALGRLKRAAVAGGAATTAGLGIMAATVLTPAPAAGGPGTELVPAAPVVQRQQAPARAPAGAPVRASVAPAAPAPAPAVPAATAPVAPARPAPAPADAGLPTACAARTCLVPVDAADKQDPTLSVVLPDNPVIHDVGLDLDEDEPLLGGTR